MYHLVDNLQDKAGNALVGYYVKLKVPGGAYATLYADTSGTPIISVSGVADTAVTDANGMYDIYVDEGDYETEFFDKADINQRILSITSRPMFANTSATTALGQLADTDGSGLVGFIASGASAVARTVQAKLREGRVSVKDFGATGDGTTDDTAAINLAIATLTSGKTLYFPSGNYLVSVTDGEKTLTAIPVGVNVYMEPNAWLYLDTADAVTTAFVPLGSNVLTVNVDGRSLAEGSTVDAGTWLNSAHGVRAYASAAYGLGASDVTVINSRFRNLRYAIQTEGATGWQISGNRFERTQLSAILMGANTGYSCTHNRVSGNLFENIGDYACAFYEVAGNTTGQSAFNSIIGNTAAACNLSTNGHAFGWELGQAALQHHNLIANNIYDRQRADLTFTRGMAVLGTNTNSAIIGNIGKGAGATSSADEGITCAQSLRCLIEGNTVSNYRGSGINVDGCDDIAIHNNAVTDCGGSGSAYPIMFARTFGGRSISVRGNRVSTTASFPSYAAGVPAIGGDGNVTYQVRDITIQGNTLDRPIDYGIQITGDPTLPPTNITIDDNDIVARESDDPASTFFESFPILVRYAKAVTISSNRFWDAKQGIYARDTEGVTLRDNEFNGTQTSGFGLWASGSTKINSDGNVVRVAVTNMLNGDTPSTLGSTSFFGMNDAFFPMVNAADDTAAATAGVNVGMYYHNAGAVRRRVA